MPDDISGVVFDVDHFSVHDGPGIRTSIFLKGCSLSCRWCHSPESQILSPQLLFAANRCVDCGLCTTVCPEGLHKMVEGKHVFVNRERCILCGKCAELCPSGSLFISGRLRTSSDVAAEALEDTQFYRNSGGGVTLSGGEVLFQPEFATDILRKVKTQSVNTIVETSGNGRKLDLLAMVPYVDTFYYDYKLADAALLREYTGANISLIRQNLEALRNATDNIVLRVPLIPGISDTYENLKNTVDIAHKLEISTVHLLPYNYSAGAKYEWCGLTFGMSGSLPQPSEITGLLDLGGDGVEVIVMQ